MAERIECRVGRMGLPGDLTVPDEATGLVIFAHGSGSSRRSGRNRHVAERLNDDGFATLLFDLLTENEADDRRNVFDIPLLGLRVVEAVQTVGERDSVAALPVGLFGASTGAAAALIAAARLPQRIAAVVSRGGRPDLAADVLPRVRAPTLLIVGGADEPVIAMNEAAFAKLDCVKALEIVPGATHLFEEEGALDTVVTLAARWFRTYLG